MSLDPEREKNLWQLCSEGDLDAREELIVAYRPLVFWIAGKIHFTDTVSRQDMIQEGMIAMINAVDKFEPEREYKFSTYAYHKIHGQMINFLERNERKAPVPVSDEVIQIAEASQEYTADQDWLDASEAIAKLDGREAEVVNALFFEGKKPRDVAHEKQLDVSHVYRLRRSAIARIRGFLGLSGA